MYPRQKLSDKEKEEQFGSIEGWYVANIKARIVYIGSGNFSINNTYRRLKNYNLVNGIINSQEYEYITHFLGQNEKLQFPAKLQNFNIIKPVIDVLKGEYIQRPFSYDVYAANEDAVDSKQEIEINYKVEVQTKQLLERWKELGLNVDDKLSEYKELNNIYDKGFKLGSEITAKRLLDYIIQDTDFRKKKLDGWNDLLVGDAVIYKIDGGKGYTHFRRVNPINCYFVVSSESDFLHDANSCVELRFLTLSEILDEFLDFLTPDDLQKLQDMGTGNNVFTSTVYDYGNIENQEGGNPFLSQNWAKNYQDKYPVYNVEWMSLKEMFIVTTVEADGRMYDELYKEEQEIKDNQRQEKIWVNCVREGVQIANQIFVKMQEREVDYRKLDDLNHVELSYTGIITTKMNSVPMSIVDVGEPYQHLYNSVWFHMTKEMANAAGKVVSFDINQFPTSMNISIEDFIYYMKTMGIIFTDSSKNFEKGIPTQPLPVKDIDLTMSANIIGYLKIMDKIKSDYEACIGVNAQRQGGVIPYQTAEGTEKALTQSGAITEPIFFIHNEVIKHCLRKILYQAKHSFRAGKKAQYILPEQGVQILNVMPEELSFYDFGIILEDSGKLNKQLQEVMALRQSALQAGQANFRDVLKTIRHSNLAEIEAILDEALEKSEKQNQERLKHEQEMQQQDLQYKDKIAREQRDHEMAVEKMKEGIKLQELKMEAEYQTKLGDEKLNQRRAEDSAKAKQADQALEDRVIGDLNKKENPNL